MDGAALPPVDVKNPFLVLAFMPAEIAMLYESMRFLFIATLATYIWDWLMSIAQEHKMVKKDGFTFTMAIYFASRLATLTFIVMVTLFLIIPFPNCNAVSLAISVLSICTCVTTTYLFLLRVRAIFHGHRLIVGFFVILWVAVNGASILVPFSTQAGNIPGTQQCITTYMHPRAAIYAILHIINHILTFFSISWKLVVMQHGGPGDMRRILQGKDFPRLSRAIWSSGQLYFFTTIGLNIVNITFMLHPKLHPLYHSMLVTANVGLENAMATRIFRQLKFDAGRQYIDTIVQSSFGPHSHSYPNSNTAANDSGRSKGAHGGAYTDSGQGSLPLALMNGAPSQALQVNVQKHVENGSVALEVKSSAY